MRGAKRGLTLVEVMLALSLLALTMAMIYPIMSRTTRVMLRAEADTQAQQKAAVLLERFFADFAYSTRNSLTLLDSFPAAGFLSQEPVRYPGLPMLVAGTHFFPSSTDSSPVVWQKFVAMCYRPEQKCLERTEYPYPAGSQVGCLTPDQLGFLLGDSRYFSSVRVVVSGIDDIKFVPVGDSSLAVELTSKERFDVERSLKVKVIMSMRN